MLEYDSPTSVLLKKLSLQLNIIRSSGAQVNISYLSLKLRAGKDILLRYMRYIRHFVEKFLYYHIRKPLSHHVVGWWDMGHLKLRTSRRLWVGPGPTFFSRQYSTCRSRDSPSRPRTSVDVPRPSSCLFSVLDSTRCDLALQSCSVIKSNAKIVGRVNKLHDTVVIGYYYKGVIVIVPDILSSMKNQSCVSIAS